MTSTPNTSGSGFAAPTFSFFLLPAEIRNIVYEYVDLEVDIHVAPTSSNAYPRTLRVYGGDLASLASIHNSLLRSEVLSLRTSCEVVARTAAQTNMRDLIASISTPQFHNLVDLQVELTMDFSQEVFPIVRFAPASFGHHLTKLRRLRFVLTGAPFTVTPDRIRAFCDEFLAYHPTLTVVNQGPRVLRTIVFTIT